MLGAYCDLLGVATLLGQRQHPVADFEFGDALTKRSNLTDRKLARCKRAFWQKLILAGDDQAINKIDRRRLDGDEDLARPGIGSGKSPIAWLLIGPNSLTTAARMDRANFEKTIPFLVQTAVGATGRRTPLRHKQR